MDACITKYTSDSCANDANEKKKSYRFFGNFFSSENLRGRTDSVIRTTMTNNDWRLKVNNSPPARKPNLATKICKAQKIDKRETLKKGEAKSFRIFICYTDFSMYSIIWLKAFSQLFINLSSGWFGAVLIVPVLSGEIQIFNLTINIICGIVSLLFHVGVERKIYAKSRGNN